MGQVEIKRQLGEGDIAAVSTLLEAAAAHDGHFALDEHRWLDLVQGGREPFAGVVAWEKGRERPVGFAQVSFGHESWALEYVIDPECRSATGELDGEVLTGALAVIASEGGGHVHLWVTKPTETTDAIAASVGLERGRDLLQLRRPLPVGEPYDLAVRPFVAGRDEEAWLEVNNRAFDSHPEQGGWDLATIKAREAEPWFDPPGFLMYEQEGRLAGFCWTKVHADHEPPLGEIYVIAVDPDFAGQGLGRRLVLAGLDHLSGKGLRVGMLYVDGTNTPARRLYDHLGFSTDHIDRAYVGNVQPVPTARPTP